MKIALVLLTKNEIECVKHIIPMLPACGKKEGYDKIYAIDGGSTDGTVEFFKKSGITVIGQSRKGRGEAFQLAFKKIIADAYIFFSPDGNEDISDLDKFKIHLEEGNDLVIASRMMKGAYNEEDRQIFKFRKWANNAFNFIANVIFNRSGKYITDTINGYRAIKRKAALALNLDAADYTIEYQMSIRAFKNNLKIIEFPTIEGERISGVTQAKSIPTGLRFLRALIREIFLINKGSQ